MSTVIETYPLRQRGLLYDEVDIEGSTLPLHVVCEHRSPNSPVDVVTAYIPENEIWETSKKRRGK